MKIPQMRRTAGALFVLMAAVFVILSSVPMAFGQFGPGALNPPGPPNPTMKTLDTLEPRTPITSLPFTINQAGSYFLTGALTGVAGQDGITVNADDVTLDLNGFSMTGVPGSLNGIACTPSTMNFYCHSGYVAGWDGSGISCPSGHQCRYYDLSCFENGNHGLHCGDRCSVYNCFSYSNDANAYLGGTSSYFHRCWAYDCFTGVGFECGDVSRVEDCVAVGCATGYQCATTCYYTGCYVASCTTGYFGTNSRCYSCSAVNCLTNFRCRECYYCFARGGANGYNCSTGSTLYCCSASNCSGSAYTCVDSCILYSCTAVSCGSGYSSGNYCSHSYCTSDNCNATGYVGATNCSYYYCRASRCLAGGSGYATGVRCYLYCCTANDCQFHGFQAGADNSIEGCTSYGHAANAYDCGLRCRVSNCTAAHCSFGIVCSSSCQVMQCYAANCVNDGIRLGDGSSAVFCRANSCAFGINAFARCRVYQCSGNLNSVGILASGNESFISKCYVSGSTVRGFELPTVGGNVVLTGNVAIGNLANYLIQAGNKAANIIAPGAGFISNEPFANIEC